MMIVAFTPTLTGPGCIDDFDFVENQSRSRLRVADNPHVVGAVLRERLLPLRGACVHVIISPLRKDLDTRPRLQYWRGGMDGSSFAPRARTIR